MHIEDLEEEDCGEAGEGGVGDLWGTIDVKRVVWQAVEDYYYLQQLKKTGKPNYLEYPVVKSPACVPTPNLVTFDENSFIMVSESDLDGYDVYATPSNVGNSIYAELNLISSFQFLTLFIFTSLSKDLTFELQSHSPKLAESSKNGGDSDHPQHHHSSRSHPRPLGSVPRLAHQIQRQEEERVIRGRWIRRGGEPEELLRDSPAGSTLTAHDILDAPGEVVGKSGVQRRCTEPRVQRGGAALLLLRFVRPACAGRTKEILPAVSVLGTVRHPNLVPLRAMYVGPRGEKLFVHPFYLAGNLSQFLHDGNAEAHRWEIIYKISLGIAKGLDYLHTGLQKPLIHGNLKSNNILLEADFRARISDYGLHLLLNPTAGQEMLEAAAAQGYKAPELIKMKEATKESDIYSMGVIFLEMITFGRTSEQQLPALQGSAFTDIFEELGS
ncbi:hypothetical protein J5N97_000624 [Dioscorea zingiberensis]|uniref:Protein kinase domain-containing protein n=1 Tax=Dioscorea zingiberensis TaxID=325984 RepID=A0A9D5BSB7_9LILI|nr:hypothetical protein J5N97_000624 [Dioscorea zingiberensis]